MHYPVASMQQPMNREADIGLMHYGNKWLNT